MMAEYYRPIRRGQKQLPNRGHFTRAPACGFDLDQELAARIGVTFLEGLELRKSSAEPVQDSHAHCRI